MVLVLREEADKEVTQRYLQMLEGYPTQIKDTTTTTMVIQNTEEQLIILEVLHRTIFELIKMAFKLL